MELEKRCFQVVKKYSSHIKAVVLIMFLIHGAKLNAGVVGIDTEALIYGENSFYHGWLNNGRQGLVLLKHIFQIETFNPYFAAMLTLLVFPAAVFGYFWLWDSVRGMKSSLLVWILGSILWISHPVITEQFYFSLQSFEIAFGFLITAAALYLTLLWTEKTRRLWAFGMGIVLLLLTFSIYQAFVPFYIFGAVTVLFLQTMREFDQGEQKMAVRALARTGGWMLVFLTAFVINTAITQKFFGSSGYLAEQINWGTAPSGEIFRRIFDHIKSVLLGRSPVFYNAFYGRLLICSTVLLVVYLWRHGRKNIVGCVTVGFLYLVLQTMPFLMTFLQGGEPVLRSQLVLPAMTGFQVMLCLWLVEDLTIAAKTVGRVVLAGVVFLGLLCGARTVKITWSLYYTDQLRYEQDAALGRSLIQRIEEVCDQEDTLPVVVVGARPFQGNHSCIQGQVMGHSLFDWDISASPVPYWSTRRVLGFLHTLGADYDFVPMDRMEDALGYSENMPEWPAEGCVQIQDGMVIVKLSDYE